MLFLKDPLSSFVIGKIKEGAMATFGALIRWLAFMVNQFLYEMISNLYDVFIALCNGQLLDSDTLNSLFGRVGMLLGVIMLFRVAFSFIQVLIDPDTFSDKERGIPKIITRVIIVIVMFGLSGYAFDFLRDVQGEVIESNVIAKFLLPVKIKTDDFGGILSAELFTAFYNHDPRFDYSQDGNPCSSEEFITQSKNYIIVNNDYSYARSCLNEIGTIKETGDEEYLIKFNWIFSTIVAIFTLYFLFNYCISIGVRVIQLAVLQIMSPMAIVSYLSPSKDNMFSKWSKIYFSTYIDAFIRIAIINFVVYLCGIIIQNWNSGTGVFWESVGAPSGFTKTLIGILMIMALLSFAKKAPELIKNLFPQGASGLSFGLDKDNKAGLGMAAAGAVGLGSRVIGGGAARIGHIKRHWNDENGNPKSWRKRAAMIAGGVGGTSLGGLFGLGSGLHGGKPSEALKSGKAANNKFTQWSQEGGTSGLRRLASGAWGSVGGTTAGQRQKRKMTALQNYSKLKDSMKSAADNFSFVDTKKQYLENLKASNADIRLIKDATDDYKNAQKAAIEYSFSGGDISVLENMKISMTEDDYSSLASDYNTYGSEINVYKTEASSIRNGNSDLFADYENADDTYKNFSDNADRAASQANSMAYKSSYRPSQANDTYNGNGSS